MKTLTVRRHSLGWKGAMALLCAALIASLISSGTADASIRFSDVSDGNTFSEDIDWLASRGVTRGCNPPDNTRFCPDDRVTRGQMAAFLARALDLPSGSASFSDTNGHIFEGDISRLASAGITRGCNPPDNTRFCPDDHVTRGQMAAFLNRALNLNPADGSFNDTDGHVFESDAAALAAAGITRGCNPPDNTRFCPDDYVTRGQMAAFVHRALPDLPAVVTPGANLIAATDSTYQPSISDDGRYVAFTVSWESGGTTQSAIRVLDRSAESHRDLRPGPDDNTFSHPMLSGDGKWILVGAGGQLWLVEVATGDHHVIDDDPNFGGSQDDLDVNFNGGYVAFRTANPDLIDNPEGRSEILRWDRMSGEYETLSLDVSGQSPTQGAIGWGRISDDGSKVMFESNQPDMADDTPVHFGIYPTYLYVHDFDTGETELVSRDQGGKQVGGVLYSTFSGDGTTVAYELDNQYVIRNLGSGAVEQVPVPSNVVNLNRTTLSTDGTVLGYFGEIEGPEEGWGPTQLFSWDTSTNRLLSRSASGEPADHSILANTFSPGHPALSGDGRWAAFTSQGATNLGAPEPGGTVDGELQVAHVFISEASPGS